jgi:hypothetical protein
MSNFNVSSPSYPEKVIKGVSIHPVNSEVPSFISPPAEYIFEPAHPGVSVLVSKLPDTSEVDGVVWVPDVKPEKSSEKTTTCPEIMILLQNIIMQQSINLKNSDFFIMINIYSCC